MQNIEVQHLKDGKIALVFDPKARLGASKTGKTTIVASTHGNTPIAMKDGSVITVGVNAYVKN